MGISELNLCFFGFRIMLEHFGDEHEVTGMGRCPGPALEEITPARSDMKVNAGRWFIVMKLLIQMPEMRFWRIAVVSLRTVTHHLTNGWLFFHHWNLIVKLLKCHFYVLKSVLQKEKRIRNTKANDKQADILDVRVLHADSHTVL